MSMGVAEEVIAALSGGGAAVARMEIARLVNTAVLRLSGRGRAAAELARVAEAAARSDADLAEAMDRLTETDRQAAAGQLDEALAYDGDDPAEQAATAELRQQAEQVRQLLINHGLAVTGSNPGIAVQHNTGQTVQNTGHGTMHAPFQVGGNYHAGPVSHFHMSGRPVEWPVWVGVVPHLADRHQTRAGVQQQLDEHLESGTTAVLTQADGEASLGVAATRVLSGLGGNGKTQLAAAHARRLWADGELDLLGWVSAASRDSILSGYAAAARGVGLGVDGLEAEQAAEAFLSWCETVDRRWLLVLDDLADPAHLTGLWPTGPAGRVLVTTRRHDATLNNHGRKLIDVGLFTPDEAGAYLSAKLPPDQLAQAADLADELGYLPLALAQAAAAMAEQGWSCADYRHRFADQRRRLADLMPADAVADDYATGPHATARATIATTWALSIAAADQLPPTGLASTLLGIAAFLDPNGIPVSVFTTANITPATDNPSAEDGGASPAAKPLNEDYVRAGLGNLARLSLADLDRPPARATTVRVHALVQRAVRDGLDPDTVPLVARAAADLLLAAWPDEDYRPDNALLAASLRANATNLTGLAPDALWAPGPHGLLWRAGRSLKDAGQPHAATDYHAALLEQAENRLGPDHPGTLTARGNLAYIYKAAGRLTHALPLFEATLAASERVLGPDHPNTLTSRNNLAGAYEAAGRLSDALPLLEATLTDRERVLGPDHPATLISRNHLAYAYRAAGRLTDALPLLEATAAAFERVLGPDHPDTLTGRNNLASAYHDAGRLTDALPLLEATLTARERVLGPDHPDTLISRANLAIAYQAAGRLTDALPLLEATLIDRERVLGPDHPDTLSSRGNLAGAYQAAGRLTDALPLYEATAAAFERVLGPDHPDTLISRDNLAGAYQAADRHTDALPLYEATAAAFERVLDPDHPDTLTSRGNLASAYRAAGRLTDALPLYEATAAAFERVLGPDHPNTLTSRGNLASAYQAAGRLTDALPLLEATAAAFERVLGPDHPDTLTSRNNLANAYQAAGRLTDALPLYEATLTAFERVLGPDHPNTLTSRNNLARARSAEHADPGS